MKRAMFVGVLCGAAVVAPAFAGLDEIITFDEVLDGTPVDGLIVKNATFSFQYDDRGGGAEVGFGPVTPNSGGQMILGPTFGALGVKFSQPVERFGFGFGLNTFFTVRDAVCVDLFDDAGVYLGTLKGDALSEVQNRSGIPANGYLFADGFGCIGSAVVTFAIPGFQSEGGDFAGTNGFDFFFDNLGYDFCDMAPVPLPSASLLGGAGLMALGAVRRRRTA